MITQPGSENHLLHFFESEKELRFMELYQPSEVYLFIFDIPLHLYNNL
jgi:hypothetical protein